MLKQERSNTNQKFSNEIEGGTGQNEGVGFEVRDPHEISNKILDNSYTISDYDIHACGVTLQSTDGKYGRFIEIPSIQPRGDAFASNPILCTVFEENPL